MTSPIQNKLEQSKPPAMDLIARTAFKQVYPFLAAYIVKKYGITDGWCLDIGSGPALLAIAMASITRLNILAVDISPDIAGTALTNIAEAHMLPRILPVTADVHSMPFTDDSVDIIVSRNSVFFWHDRPQAFREIYRVLKPGGVAFCGGGMGSETIRCEADRLIMNEPRLEGFRELWVQRNRGLGIDNSARFLDELRQAGVAGVLDHECQGLWIEIKK